MSACRNRFALLLVTGAHGLSELARAGRAAVLLEAERGIEAIKGPVMRLCRQRCRRSGLELVVTEVQRGRLPDSRHDDAEQHRVQCPFRDVPSRLEVDLGIRLDLADFDRRLALLGVATFLIAFADAFQDGLDSQSGDRGRHHVVDELVRTVDLALGSDLDTDLAK